MTASDSNRGFRQRLLDLIDRSGVSDRRLSMLATGSIDTVRNMRAREIAPSTLGRKAAALGTGRIARLRWTATAWPHRLAALFCVGMAVIGGCREASAQSATVCDRTVQVRSAIEAASGGTGCASLTLDLLREITTLDLRDQGISSLRTGDFDGLYTLKTLDLSGNTLASLPAGLFDELYLLRTLHLKNNRLTTLPTGIFDKLLLLETLSLTGNTLTALPEGMFDGLSRFKGAHLGQQKTGLDRLRQFITDEAPTTVEAFIEALPALHKERFVFVYDSDALGAEFVSRDHPRVISYGADARHVFSWQTNPDATDMLYKSVEFLIPADTAWISGVVDFSGEEPEITHPDSCQTCHGPKNKPLFTGYDWPGTENLDYLSDDGYEREQVMLRLRASTNSRIAPLDLESANYSLGYGRRLTRTKPSVYPYLFPAEEASLQLAMRHGEQLLQRLKSSADYAEFAEDFVCFANPNDAVDIIRTRFYYNYEHSLAHFANSGDVVGGADAGLYASVVSGAYDFRTGTIPGIVRLLILQDFWNEVPEVRELYRRTSNADLPALSGPRVDNNFSKAEMLIYPVGGATAEDELIALYRLYFGYGNRASLTALDLANSPFVEAGRATSDFEAAHTNMMAPRVCEVVRNKRLNQLRPHGLQTAVSGAAVLLSWNAPTDDTGVTGYRIKRGTDANSLETLVADTRSTVTSYTDTTVTAGFTYYYSVTVLRGDVVGNESPRIELTVTGPQAPDITGSTTFTVVEGGAAVATLTATDTDTAVAELAWSIPAGAAGGADAGKFTLSSAGVLAFAAAKDFEAPDDADTDGSYQVTVQVSDGGLTDTADLTVTLANHNEAPTANAGADQTDIDPGAAVTLSGGGSDPDADETLSYNWTQTAGTTVTLTGADTAMASFTAPSGLTSDSTLTFTLKVTDAGTLFHEDTVSVTVVAGSGLTAALENAPASHDGSTAFTVRLRFSEEVALSYTAFTSGLLAVTGGSVTEAHRTAPPSNVGWDFTVTPSGSGDVVITLPANRACDVQPTVCTPAGRRLSQVVTVTVTGPQAPDITGSTTFTVVEGGAAVATLTVTDTDTAVAELAWSIPAGAAGGADAGKFTLSSAGVLAFAAAKDFEAPDDADTDGSYQVTVQVSDGGLTDTADLTVTLANHNEAPTANAGADQTDIDPGAAVTLSGGGSDPDADETLSYSWTQTAGTTVTLTGADTATASFTAPSGLTSDSTLTFTLKVTDAGTLFHEDTVSVTVVAGSGLTAALENAPASHDGSTAFTVRLRFSEEVALSYTAFTSGLLAVTGGSVTEAHRTAPPSNVGWDFTVTPSGSGDVVITLPANRACDVQPTVCTPAGRRLSQVVTVTVTGPQAPDITGSTTFTVVEGGAAVATLTVTDTDTAVAELAWSIPAGAAGGADAGKFTLSSAGVLAFAAAKDFEAPDDADTDGSYQVTVQVSDGGLTDTADLTVTLANHNEAPTANAGADQTDIDPGAAVTLSGGGSDPDADETLSYNWTQTAGTTVTLTGADTATASFTAPSGLTSDSTLTFTLKVTDAGTLFHEDAVSVTVKARTPEAPVATIAADTTPVTEGTAAAFTVSLDTAATETLTVAIEVSETGSMLSGATPTGIAFASGDRTKAVTLATATDATVESDSTVTVTLGTGSGYTLGTAASARVIVTDNDTPLSDDASLSALSLSGLDIGAFSAEVTEYSAEAGEDVAATTVTATPSDAAASVTIADADGSTTGTTREVALSTGANTITVTVTAEDGSTVEAYIVTVTRAESELAWGTRLADKDIESNDFGYVTGLWGSDSTLWVFADGWGPQVMAFDTEGNRESEQDVNLQGTGGYVTDIWSDGETIWATIFEGGAKAYALDGGARVSGKDLSESLTAAGNDSPTGMWSDQETVWVADYYDTKMYAYQLSDGARLAAKEFSTMIHGAPNHTHPRGVWSDGETVLIADWLGGKVRAYRLSDGTRVPTKDIDTADAGNVNPTGLWSDGETLWVGDDTKGKVYAYAVPAPQQSAGDEAVGARGSFTVRAVTRADAAPGAQGAKREGKGWLRLSAVPPPPTENKPPTADVGPDQTGAREGALVALDGSVSSDPDDDPLRYRWNQLSGVPVVLSSQNIVNPIVTAPEGLTTEAVLQFRLLVTDPEGLFDSDTVTIKVDPEAEPPLSGDWTYYFPHLAVGAGWQTTITSINYSPREVICQTEFLSDQGTPLLVSFADRGTVVRRTDVLPPGGSVHQETNVGLSAPLAPGWVRATCTEPVKASLLFRGYDSEGVPVSETGVNAATAPATRFVTFAEQGEGQLGTGVAYANPSATEAVVTFTARDADGQMLASVHPGPCRPVGMVRKIWRLCLVCRALPDRSKLPPRRPSSVCRSMPKPLRCSPPCLRGNWMPPRRERRPITFLILPWERGGKPPSRISTTPRRR